MAEKGSTSKSKHPPTSKMVEIAIRQLKERNGSSRQAITKFIATNFEVDMNYIYSRIKAYLKKAIEQGILINTTGIGASGSFKFSKKTTEKMEKDEKAKMKKVVQSKKKEEKKSPNHKKVTRKKQPSESESKNKTIMDVKRKGILKVKAIKV